jgi:hypothetical protein
MKPGDYLLRSPASRAAARRTLHLRRDAQVEGTVIRLVSPDHSLNPDQKCTCPLPPEAIVTNEIQGVHRQANRAPRA